VHPIADQLIFEWHASGLSRLLDLTLPLGIFVGALAFTLWIVLLRRKASGLRVAAGWLGLVLFPVGVLALICVEALRPTHGLWLTLLLAVPTLSMLTALSAIAWLAIKHRPFADHECGRCRQQLHPEQSACAECGWVRGRPHGVAQARMFALAALGGISAAMSLLALIVGLWMPLTWTMDFDAEVLTDRTVATPGGASFVRSGEIVHQVFGRSTHRMSVFGRDWRPIGFSRLGFLCESPPNRWTTYLTAPEDERAYTNESLEALPKRLADAMAAVNPPVSAEVIARTAAVQAGFVRALKSSQRPSELSAAVIRITITDLTPPSALLVAPMVAGPAAAVSIAVVARRRRHQKA